MFGTNGVRFIPGVGADLEFVIKFAECIGTYFSDGEVLVGRDGRLSGEALSLALTSGLMSSGRSVAEAGLVPTPALQYAVKALGYRGGVMVTASHNPAEYNGLKVIGPDGVEINRLDEQKVEKIFRDGSLRRADWKDVGTSRAEPSVIRTYLSGILSKADTGLISGRKFSVVVRPRERRSVPRGAIPPRHARLQGHNHQLDNRRTFPRERARADTRDSGRPQRSGPCRRSGLGGGVRRRRGQGHLL